MIQYKDTPHILVEITNRWTKLIDKRADLDLKLTNRKAKSIPLPLVLETWEGTGIAFEKAPKREPPEERGGGLVGSRPNSREGVK